MTQIELNKSLLNNLLHKHLTHDDSESFLGQLDDYNLMNYEEIEQGFILTYQGDQLGTITPLEDNKFKFESVNNAIDHYNDSYDSKYHVLEDLLYVVFTDGLL